jgi:hypothetical protein
VHELYALKEVTDELLLTSGYELLVEESHPDVFGSYFAEYSRGARRVRFVWDGRDGWGFLETRTVDSSSWDSVGEPIRESTAEEMRTIACASWPGPLAPFLSNPDAA